MEQTITIYNNYPQIGFPGSKNEGVLGVAPPFTLLKRPARFSATPVVSEHSNDAVNQLAREEQLWCKVNCSGGGLDLPREKGNFTQFNQQTWEFIVNLC